MEPRRMTVEEQIKDTDGKQAYAMKLRFKVDLEPVEINDIAKACGFQETLVARDAGHYYIEQTVPFIPDEATIRKYESIIKEEHKAKTAFRIHGCTFNGYEYLYPVTTEKETKGRERAKVPDSDLVLNLRVLADKLEGYDKALVERAIATLNGIPRKYVDLRDVNRVFNDVLLDNTGDDVMEPVLNTMLGRLYACVKE